MPTNFKHFLCTAVATFLMVSSANAGTYLTHGPNVDMKKAYMDLQTKAGKGNAKADLDLARHYGEGDGVEQNKLLAFTWAEKAANHNLAEAKLYLAKFYLTGTFVSEDIRHGEALLVQAAKLGSEEAYLILGRLYTRHPEKKDFATASMWLEKSADLGSTKAMEMMAVMYLDGRVVEPDYSKAVYWLQRGSDAGDLGATYSLADFYMQGTGVAKDPVTATRLLKETATKGYAYSIDYFVEQARENNSEAQQFLEQLHAEQGHDTEAFKKYRQEAK